MDLFNTKSFKAMESSLYALQLQTQVSAQNLANLETPNYKAKTVTFEDVFKDARNKQDGHYAFRAKIQTDNSTVVRTDGNNVDSDAESVKLVEAYFQSLYLMDKISGQFTNIKYTLENAPK